MNRTLHHVVILLLLLASGRLAAGEGTNAATRADFQSFRLIADRNIFNPNRSAPGVRVVRTSRHAKVDSFSLVGTMSYEKGSFAFFDGTSSEFRKTVHAGDDIAGYKITGITPNEIKLAAAGNQTLDLRVGMEMKRQDGGPWSLITHAEYNAGADAGSSSAETTDQTKETAPSGDMAEIIKRMMLKREQEK